MDSVYILVSVFIASFIGTTVGFGTSTVLIPILTWLLPLPELILFVGVVHWFGDVWKIGFFRKGLRWDIIALFTIPGIILTIVGAWLIRFIPLNFLLNILGIFLICYMVLVLLKPKLQLKATSSNLVLGGGVSGFFAGLLGMGGAIRGFFLSLFDLPKVIYIATSGVIALLIDSTRLSVYFMTGIGLSETLVITLILAVPISFFAGYTAKRVVDYIPQKYFRMIVAVCLGLIGLKLILN